MEGTGDRIELRLGYRHLQFVLLVSGVFLVSLTGETAQDLWWFLALGRYIVQHHAFPARDVFSYTASVADRGGWLFGVLAYVGYSAGGLKLLALGKAAVFSAASLAALLLTLRRSGSRVTSLAAVAFAALASRAALAVSPELLSYLLLAFLLLCVDFLYGGMRKPLILFPLVMLLWANIDRLAFLGLAALLIQVIGEIASRLLKRQASRNGWRRLRRGDFTILLTVFAVSCLAFACGQSGSLSAAFAAGPVPVVQYPLFAAFLLAAVFTLVMFVPTMEPADTMLIVGAGLFSITSVRHIPFLPLCAAPIVAREGARFLLSLPAETVASLRKWRPLIDPVAAALLGSLVVCAFFLPGFGPRGEGGQYPAGASKYIASRKPAAELFNSPDWGGYLMWTLSPRYRVFIDGRGGDAYSPILLARYRNVEQGAGGWDRVLGLYGANTAVIPMERRFQNLIEQMNAEGNWRLGYWDLQSMVFLRNTGANRPLIDGYEYRVYNAQDAGFRGWAPEIEVQIMSELYNYLKANPDSLGARNLLAVTYMRKGMLDSAIAEFEKVARAHPALAKVHYNLGMLYSQKGEQDKAAEEYEKEIGVDAGFAPACNNLGRILYEKGDFDRAEKYFKKAIKIDPRYTLALNNLGLIYLEEGRVPDAIAEFKKALELDPRYEPAMRNMMLAQDLAAHPAETYNRMGQIYYSQGNLERAEKQFEKALAQNPKYSVAMGNLGVISMRRGQFEKAARAFKEALALNPGDDAARQNLAMAESMAAQKERGKLPAAIAPGGAAQGRAAEPPPEGQASPAQGRAPRAAPAAGEEAR